MSNITQMSSHRGLGLEGKMGTESVFGPRIVGFLCNWCSYAGADLCGVSRFQYPAHIRTIRVMCTGRVDPAFILRAFSNEADGIYIGGCWPGECHYTTEGNYHALGMVRLTKKLLEWIGVNPERLKLEWVSASEGIRFASTMNEFGAQVEELGPLGKSEGIDEDTLRFKLEAVKNLLPYIKLVERERMRVAPFDSVEEYDKFFASDEVERLFHELIADKLATSQIMLLLRAGPLSNGEIAQALGLDQSEASRHVNNLVRQGLVMLDENQKTLLLPGVREQARAERA
jgi:F420-non-reducing hydrogenase iron-sulfur subunit